MLSQCRRDTNTCGKSRIMFTRFPGLFPPTSSGKCFKGTSFFSSELSSRGFSLTVGISLKKTWVSSAGWHAHCWHQSLPGIVMNHCLEGTFLWRHRCSAAKGHCGGSRVKEEGRSLRLALPRATLKSLCSLKRHLREPKLLTVSLEVEGWATLRCSDTL